ncbi:nickel/cobalt efflux transporter [Methylobacterium platani]|uniref:Nickel/cobalt efflux system n=2 Tax=Methylobacterium platani TaxID=427683 RepID=A0A179S0U2_9HYPH|nr:nickel/cobalt efflux transporter [Methylobacterium platani]KMO21285.1 nickel transporter [Methylobacterium platani JCM 14648]OAS18770.1 nickel/cobalt efflux protein RcnA [Methylobacterium platani]
MTPLTDLLQQGTAHAWLFVPTAILLGALHGLEPGHSKTMMAAFIIAVRGTVMQAVLLGLAATLSHTAVVWAIALGGQYVGRHYAGEASEPYFQLASAVLIVGIALWMAWRTWREQHHHHDHDDAAHPVTTGTGLLTLAVFEDGVPPRWRVRSARGTLPEAGALTVETLRPDGTRQVFGFVRRGDVLESLDEIPEPHAFTARLRLDAPAGTEIHEVAFEEHDHLNHDHPDLGDEDDAHARAHADDIRRRFAGRTVTTGQIVLFGLTGGLIPCPAAITVLLLCIQLKQFSLGFALVVCFSIGLALTMVSAGVLAALSVKHVASRWSGFGSVARQAPYASAVLIVLVGLYTGWLGWQGIRHGAADHAAGTGIARAA